MATAFVAEIRVFPYSFAPDGWALCDGQLLPISQNTALFSLLGTTYGGDGRSTFALPDLRGAVPMHPGLGTGSLYELGQAGGADSVQLSQSEMPQHAHALQASPSTADLTAPGPSRSLARGSGGAAYVSPASALTTMHPTALAPAGASQPHNNLQPYLTFSFCISLTGVYPPRQ